MNIKHVPAGLHPYFDSGYERRPYWPEPGQKIAIGCRLDNFLPSTEPVLHWTCGEESGVLNGIRHSDPCCFTFTLLIPQKMGELMYHFEASQGADIVVSPNYTMNTISQTEYRACQFTSSRLSISREVSDDSWEQEKKTIHYLEASVAQFAPTAKLWTDHEGRNYKLTLMLRVKGQAVFGLGERFDAVDQAGRTPLSYVQEKFTTQGDACYLPIPFFFTDAGFGLLLHGTTRTQFFFSQPDEAGWIDVCIEAYTPPKGALLSASLYTGAPEEILREYTAETGGVSLPPRWSFGLWLSANGWSNQKEAIQQLELSKAHGIPFSVMVLEAWSDEETFYIWNDAQYTPRADGSAFSYADFTFPSEGRWPNPKAMLQQLRDNGIRLVLWQIPVVKSDPMPHEQLVLDTQYAIDNKLCIQNADGSPYRVTEMWFGDSMMVDFTHPDARRWWFDKRRYLVEELGVSGFKTDGGEFLFAPDATQYDGCVGAEAHSAFSNRYAQAYHEFMQECGAEGVTFSRSGYTGAGRFPIHWAGDQLSTFEELRAQLMAGLSAGLSGVPFWSFDIGGFAGPLPTKELFLRATAMGVFCPIMQIHAEPRDGQFEETRRSGGNNDRTPWNLALVHDDAEIIELFRQFAVLRAQLLPYLWQEAQHCAAAARPMMAHLVYDYPHDAKALATHDQYMLGRDLLVAPLLYEGIDSRMVYLPEGDWVDFRTNERFTGPQTLTVTCGLEKIPVYVRYGAALPMRILPPGIVGPEACADNAVESDEHGYTVRFGEDEGNAALLWYGRKRRARSL